MSRTLTTVILAAGFLYIPTLRLGSQNAPAPTMSFVGTIMDSKCAPKGSHVAMMKKLGVKSPRDCTLRCAMDGSFVLYDSSSQNVYQLDDQQKPVPFAGQRVKVTGGYDEKSQMIEVETIEPVH